MALFNTVTNFVSSAVLICFYPVFVRIGNLFNVGALTPQTVDFGKGIGAVGVFASIMIPIALTDTILSVCRAVISMLLKRVLMPVVNSVISQPEDEKPHLSILKIGARISPVLACDQVLVEVDFMKQSIFEMFDCAYKVISGVSKNDQGPEKHIVHRERILDNVQREITEFLGSVMSNRLPVEVAERARRLLRLTDELESASDELAKILKIIKRLASDGRELTQETKKLLLEVHNSVLSEVELITPLICSPRKVFDLSSVQESSFRLKSFLRACRQSQIERIGPDDSVSAKRILAVIDVINAYDRIRAYYLNCAETLSGGKR
jgi:Na+/phosphate symporter